MKRCIVISTVALLFVPAIGSADIFTCMDCVQLVVGTGSQSHVEGRCCNSVNGSCYTGDHLVDEDVGSGCLVSEPDPEMNGSTSCISNNNDKNCPGTTGGGTRTGSLPYGSSCTPDPTTGYCDVGCASCG